MNFNNQGFSLVEILLCVVVLAGGIVIVYQPLLSSFQTLKYLDHRLEADRYLENRIWETQNDVYVQKRVPADLEEQVTFSDGRSVKYGVKTQPIWTDKLFLSLFSMKWLQAGREKLIVREAYIRVPKEDEEPTV